jgi:hypothetical protein
VAGIRRYQHLMHLPDGIAGPASFAAVGCRRSARDAGARHGAAPLRGEARRLPDRDRAQTRTTLSRIAQLNKLNPSDPLLIGA